MARTFEVYSERRPQHQVLVDYTPDLWLDARRGRFVMVQDRCSLVVSTRGRLDSVEAHLQQMINEKAQAKEHLRCDRL